MAFGRTQPQEIPVYLFTGFLEAGKTKFIQKSLEDSKFNAGERTLLIVCEEGEEEYDPSRFSFDNVVIVNIESEDMLTRQKLETHRRRSGAERVIIEYNGMWSLDKLFNTLPETWIVYQEFCFADSNTFIEYNRNMRQLTYDKLKSCDTVIFNRFSTAVDRMELHKIVRAISRRTDIIYEYPDGKTEYDDIVDPLPFDKEAAVIKIEDSDYGLWYRDLDEDMESYDNKVVEVKAIAMNSTQLPEDVFAIGRPLMTCCVEDIRVAALACEYVGEMAGTVKPQPLKWFRIKAKMRIRPSSAYGGEKGPVLEVIDIARAEAPEDEVATLY